MELCSHNRGQMKQTLLERQFNCALACKIWHASDEFEIKLTKVATLFQSFSIPIMPRIPWNSRLSPRVCTSFPPHGCPNMNWFYNRSSTRWHSMKTRLIFATTTRRGPRRAQCLARYDGNEINAASFVSNVPANTHLKRLLLV